MSVKLYFLQAFFKNLNLSCDILAPTLSFYYQIDVSKTLKAFWDAIQLI